MKYDISLAGVKEVNLLGHADAATFRDLLAPEGLHPTVRDGKAEVLVGAFDSRFMGLAFREAIVTVYTCARAGGSERDGAFLLQGFNSRSPFAWVERVMNRSPYVAASIAVDANGASSSMAIAVAGAPIFEASMEAEGRAEPARTEDTPWTGPVHLPSRGGKREMFLVELQGALQVHAFAPGRDRLRIGRAVSADVSGALAECGFEAKEWWIRPSARHSKTKTRPR